MPQLPGRKGAAMLLKQGQSLQVINTHGKQVVDFWAFNWEDGKEYLSTSHARGNAFKHLFAQGKQGIHDLLLPACDAGRYRQLGAVGYHDSCHDNLHKALVELPHIRPKDDWAPEPLNLFMNVAVDHHGGIDIRSPASDKGQYVIVRAEIDLIVVMSACPQDMVNVNGDGPADCEYRVLEEPK
ncbi:polysaccharide deacetylase family [Fusarium coicis]|nr:polysaccharide deacetylase family [Fusarium coicis]